MAKLPRNKLRITDDFAVTTRGARLFSMHTHRLREKEKSYTRNARGRNCRGMKLEAFGRDGEPALCGGGENSKPGLLKKGG